MMSITWCYAAHGQAAADLVGSVNVPTVASMYPRRSDREHLAGVGLFPTGRHRGRPGSGITTLVTWTPAQPGAARVAFWRAAARRCSLGGVPAFGNVPTTTRTGRITPGRAPT